MKVLVTGVTGFLGGHVARELEGAGHTVRGVSRRPDPARETCGWEEEDLGRAVAESDAVVHLAGENLFARRWSARQKAVIRSSRVESTALLARLVAEKGGGVLVSASAVGFYGPHGDEEVDEEAPAGTDFLAGVCRDWEAALAPATEAGVRVARARTGVVLGDGGALARLLLPFKLGIGGPIGSGRQVFPWIHVGDCARLYRFLVESEGASGAYNATAPNAVTNRELARTLGRVLHRPAFLPLPGFALRLALGEVADVLLSGQRAVPRRAQAEGFAFEHPERSRPASRP
jgi:uncharacterized protein (TIGR01777 family)